MREIVYDQNSALIAVVLLAVLLVANEVGHRAGSRYQHSADSWLKSQTAAIQGATLGLLALLLGFTFSMALQRYDARSSAVVEEANAIGTTYLRAQLLSTPHRDVIIPGLKEYVELRCDSAAVDLAHAESLQELRAKVTRLQSTLFTEAVAAANDDPRPATTGLFVQALNEMIDTYGRRQAALDRHVPEVVLFLLFTILIIAFGILGYSGGLGGARPLFSTTAIAVLIVLVIFIVIDLDRPRRGLIQVNQSSLTELCASVDAQG